MKKSGIIFLAVFMMLVAPVASRADVIPFNLNTHINDYTPVATPPPPWVTATFADTAAGEVTLTLVGTNLTDNPPPPASPPNEHVGFFYFNVNPGYDASLLSFSAGPYTTGVGNTDGFTLGNYSNAWTFDGRIYFTGDVLGKGDTINIVITGTDLNAQVFNVPDPVGLLAGAWIEDIRYYYTDKQGSEDGHAGGIGTAAVPEPATMFLLGSGLIGLAGFARKKFKK